MCGICGFIGDDKVLIKKMAQTISHRGPDAAGYFTDAYVSLGHRRLSIIDLSSAAHQPMYNENKNIALIYNGEIFNFLELKEELQKKGHQFTSHSDTEVVVHAYEEYGTDCLKLFNGFFAFCLYDSTKKILFMARDRLGKKPLYYYNAPPYFVFASEIKAILEYPGIPRKVNRSALNEYITYRYIAGEHTIFHEISRLKPGHYALYNIAHKKLEITQYWDVAIELQKKPIPVYAEQIISLLKDSIRRRLISDVPLGVYLSGGIDSSSIVALMKEYTGEINTYSLGFENDIIGNELAGASAVSKLFSTNHHERIITTDIVKDLPTIAWHLDEPLADPAVVPVYYLSQEAKKTVTVILSGDGADELFAGYDQYKFLNWGNRLSKMPRVITHSFFPFALRKIPRPILNKIYHYSSATGSKMFDRFERFIADVRTNKAKSYIEVVGVFNDEEQQELLRFTPDMGYEMINQQYFANSHDFLTQLMYIDTKRYLPEDLLMKPDKMGMAHGIEARVPYLDYRLAEYAFTIPSYYKLKGNVSKFILKKALKGYLPKKILTKKKQPFQMPLDQWFSGNLKEVFQNLLDEKITSEYFTKPAIKKICDNYNESKLYYGRQLWSLGMFALWHKVYIEGENPKKIF